MQIAEGSRHGIKLIDVLHIGNFVFMHDLYNMRYMVPSQAHADPQTLFRNGSDVVVLGTVQRDQYIIEPGTV